MIYIYSHAFACNDQLTNMHKINTRTYINEAVVEEQAKNGGSKAWLSINISDPSGAHNGLESGAGGGIESWRKLGISRTSKESTND